MPRCSLLHVTDISPCTHVELLQLIRVLGDGRYRALAAISRKFAILQGCCDIAGGRVVACWAAISQGRRDIADPLRYRRISRYRDAPALLQAWRDIARGMRYLRCPCYLMLGCDIAGGVAISRWSCDIARQLRYRRHPRYRNRRAISRVWRDIAGWTTILFSTTSYSAFHSPHRRTTYSVLVPVPMR